MFKGSELSSNSGLPLIAKPRFLQLCECARDPTSDCRCREDLISLFDGIRYPLLQGISENILSVCHYIATCDVLKFPPERVASSLVDLWEDLSKDKFRSDFLKYHAGWIGHAVLLSVKQSPSAEIIERFIEIACCLDLLCQRHLLALHTIRSLQTPAIQRLIAWDAVREPLIRNMEEIETDSLSNGLDPNSIFHAPRDIVLEYWILSRPYVDETLLWVESLTVQPPTSKSSDVESRITALEDILNTIEIVKSDNDESEPELTGFEELSTSDLTSDRESEYWDSTEEESPDEQSDSDDLVKRTRARTSTRLEGLQDSVQHKVKNQQRQSAYVTLATKASPATNRHRSIDPFDAGSIFRARV